MDILSSLSRLEVPFSSFCFHAVGLQGPCEVSCPIIGSLLQLTQPGVIEDESSAVRGIRPRMLFLSAGRDCRKCGDPLSEQNGA